MKVVIIGGSGHVGTYLVPRLVNLGCDVVNVSRGASAPYLGNAAWSRVETVTIDRAAAEADGTFGARIAALNADVVIDMICFTLDSCRHLVSALEGRVQHFLHCGTIWVYGQNTLVPATEDQPLNAFGEYGSQKAAIETFLLDMARRGHFPATVFRPGHIVGPGWSILNPRGNFNDQVWSTIKRGDELTIPNFGLETVHHVHADDVAQVAERAVRNWGAAVGEAFNAVSAQAVNLRGYAEHMYRWFGHAPRLSYQPFESWKSTLDADDAQATWEHIARSPNHSIEKGRRLLGYQPRYSSLAAAEDSVTALLEKGRI
jgi:nucleoside-diphosphate-sugar epimerase